MAMRGNKKRRQLHLLHFSGAGTCSEGDFKFYREKLQLISRFPGFWAVDRFGPRSKVVLHGKGYVWAPVLGSFDNSKR